MIDFTKAISFLEADRRIYAETDTDVYSELTKLGHLKCSLSHWKAILTAGRKYNAQFQDPDIDKYKESLKEITICQAYVALLVDHRKASNLSFLKKHLYDRGMKSNSPTQIAVALEHLGGSKKNQQLEVKLEAGNSILDLVRLGKVSVKVEDDEDLSDDALSEEDLS